MKSELMEHWYGVLFRNVVEHPLVEEICMNAPPRDGSGVLWVRMRNRPGWQPYAYAAEDLGLFFKLFANSKGSPHGDRLPWLHATLPGGARFAGGQGKVLAYRVDDNEGLCFNIRQGRSDPALEREPFPLQSATLPPSTPYRHPDPDIDALAKRIADSRKGVLTIGPPAAGKTSLNKAVLSHSPAGWRYAVYEDVREIPPTHPNMLFMVVDRTIPKSAEEQAAEGVLNMLTRCSPDALILGEVSPLLARALPDLASTGLKCGMLTIHAEDEEQAARRLWGMVARNNDRIDAATFRDLVANAFGTFVVCKRDEDTDRRWIDSVRSAADVLADIHLA